MDQATQVNFPTLSKHPRKRLQRHNTTADLRLSTPPIALQSCTTSSPFWVQNTSLPSVLPPVTTTARPKSLILSTEAFQRGNSLMQTEAAEEISLKVISPDQTPPYSSNSSIMGGYARSTSKNGGTQPPPGQQQQQHQQTIMKMYGHSGSFSSQHYLQIPSFPSSYQKSECTNSMNSCKCFYEPTEVVGGGSGGSDRTKPRLPSVTPEGLSWRRLHMSRAKLKATSTTSELLSGFAMVAMVELQINEDTAVPEWLFVMFSVCTTVLVAVHIFALMISTYILPNIDAISKLDVCELVTESPHERMKGFIELAWAFSTVLGLFLFLVEVAILCWVKFWDYSFTAAIAATVIVIPVLIIFVLFAVHFYHSLVVYRCDTSIGDMQKLEDMKRHLDQATSPV